MNAGHCGVESGTSETEPATKAPLACSWRDPSCLNVAPLSASLTTAAIRRAASCLCRVAPAGRVNVTERALEVEPFGPCQAQVAPLDAVDEEGAELIEFGVDAARGPAAPQPVRDPG